MIKYYGKHFNYEEILELVYNVFISLFNNMPIMAINGHKAGELIKLSELCNNLWYWRKLK